MPVERHEYMSYDISLYDKAFLHRALSTGLGDWTNADPIPEAAAAALIEAAQAVGFQPDGPATSFTLDTNGYLAQLSIHRGELAFTIPYSERGEATIALCTQIGKDVAATHGPAFWDPQADDSE